MYNEDQFNNKIDFLNSPLFRLYFDLNKRVYNHVPGECSYLGGAERGVGDVQLVNNHTLIASSVSLKLFKN